MDNIRQELSALNDVEKKEGMHCKCGWYHLNDLLSERLDRLVERFKNYDLEK